MQRSVMTHLDALYLYASAAFLKRKHLFHSDSNVGVRWFCWNSSLT